MDSLGASITVTGEPKVEAARISPHPTAGEVGADADALGAAESKHE